MKAFNRLPFYEQSQKVAHDSKGLIWSLVIGHWSFGVWESHSLFIRCHIGRWLSGVEALGG